MYEISVSSGTTHESNLSKYVATLSLVISYSHGVLLDFSHQAHQSKLQDVHAVKSVGFSGSTSHESGIPWKSAHVNGLFLSQITNSLSLQVSL